MLAVWWWIKSHIAWVLGGLSAVLAGWIAWGAYERRVETLKGSVDAERALTRVRVLEAQRGMLGEQDEELAAADALLEERIGIAKREAVEVVEMVKEKTDEQVADRFAELYP